MVPAFDSPGHPCSSRHASTRAFTLIELLVVLAIISILFSILVPTISRGMRYGLLVDCANNLHQMHGGNMAYAQDHNFSRPPLHWEWREDGGAILIFAGTTTKDKGEYIGQGTVLNKYLGNNIELMICKSVTIEGDNDMDREMWANARRSGSSYLYAWVAPDQLNTTFPSRSALEQHIESQKFVNDNGGDVILTDLNVRNIPGLDEPFLSHRELRRINILTVDGAVRNYSYDYGLIAERWAALDIMDFIEAANNARANHGPID